MRRAHDDRSRGVPGVGGLAGERWRRREESQRPLYSNHGRRWGEEGDGGLEVKGNGRGGEADGGDDEGDEEG